MNRQWAAVELSNETYHVIPVNDLKVHDDLRCWCGPRVEWANGNHMVVHNSADGREFWEVEEGH